MGREVIANVNSLEDCKNVFASAAGSFLSLGEFWQGRGCEGAAEKLPV